MQKVIKHGKGKRKREPLYHFTCDECGCEWVADNISVSAHVCVQSGMIQMYSKHGLNRLDIEKVLQ